MEIQSDANHEETTAAAFWLQVSGDKLRGSTRNEKAPLLETRRTWSSCREKRSGHP